MTTSWSGPRDRLLLSITILLAGTACQKQPKPANDREQAAPSIPASSSQITASEETRAPNTDAATAPPVRADGTIYAEAVMMGTHWSINVFPPPEKT
ncbi:MAG: hypothetical protein ACPHRO_04215, partial [Nannocystaceae bacterium]